ncbi:MAG: alpha/beta hydrolase [Archaeoglobaceae archaeon]|nr:alpha/beta hydrolase [Archaeoglobaceae archaeon]MCX8152598.1 alpha/beta hydrolase [Archaeoglobaceae archaeon]MDW8014120.1 alpha/beta hydrolase [Archaeoglobaceae archaeon]
MERGEVFVSGVRISYLKWKEFPIVYIHGSACDATIWKDQVEEIGGYALDLPNHGMSDKVEVSRIDDYAYFVAKFVEKKLKKAVLVGHSLGGAVIQKVYENYKEVVKALILIGTGARLRVLPDFLIGLKERPRETVKIFLKYAFSNEKIAEKFLDIFVERSFILLKDLILCDSFDLLDKYRSGEFRIEVPTLIIVGSEDKLTPVKYSQFFKNNIPSSKLVVIENASHMVMIEKPKEVNDAIKEFLRINFV